MGDVGTVDDMGATIDSGSGNAVDSSTDVTSGVVTRPIVDADVSSSTLGTTCPTNGAAGSTSIGDFCSGIGGEDNGLLS